MGQSTSTRSTRRDPRKEVRSIRASVEFDAELESGLTPERHVQGSSEHRLQGDIVSISATGIAFTLDDESDIGPGTILSSTRVHVGNCHVEGDLGVRYVRRTDDARTEIGCLFFPASLEDSARWLILVDGAPSTATAGTHLSFRCSNCHRTISIAHEADEMHRCSECRQEYRLGPGARGRCLDELHQRARALATEFAIDIPSAVSVLLGMLSLPEVRDMLDHSPALEAPGSAHAWESTPASACSLSAAAAATSEVGSSLPSSSEASSTLSSSSGSASPAPQASQASQASSSGPAPAFPPGSFDAAFVPAVEAGTLTALQAAQRGNRETFAHTLVARHHISLDDAYDVADNRTTLLSLLRQRRAGKPIRAM